MGEMIDHRTRAQRCSDWVADFCGSWGFIIWFTVLVLGWVALNSWLLFFHHAFDPYPYIALNLVLTIVSTFQGPLIMMSQNRQADRDREAVEEIRQKLDRLLRREAPTVSRFQGNPHEQQ